MGLELHFDRAFCRPGEQLGLTVVLPQASAGGAPEGNLQALQLQARISHLAQTVQELVWEASAQALAGGLSVALAPPALAPRGYGLEVAVRDGQGTLLAQASAGFDVLNHWTEAPRYGFLCDFAPGREDARETMQRLARYHVNALQFYDWMYRHDTLLPPQDDYHDPLGRDMSLHTVRALIDAAHAYNVAAMPYTAVYGASPEFYEQHPQWALFDGAGEVLWFADGFLAYMDPSPESGWTRHLLAQFDRLLRETGFDGVHLDQYGEPRQAYDASGRKFDLQRPLAALIAATKEVVDGRRDDGAVVFNCVGNWPVRAAAPAPQDLVYIEVWEPFVALMDLARLVTDAQRLGGGKPVVLAAYIDPDWEHNMRLTDAAIFASGGGRIELGEQDGALADPYFPKYGRMSPHVAAAMRRLYDFAVRYQDVVGPRTGQAGREIHVRFSGAGAGSFPGDIWPIVRQSREGGTLRTAISLINLQGLSHGRWDQELDAPRRLQDVQVEVRGISGEARAAWWASPDGDSLMARPLQAGVRDGERGPVITFSLPWLNYWDLVVVESATSEESYARPD